jgi:hypothetical protein
MYRQGPTCLARFAGRNPRGRAAPEPAPRLPHGAGDFPDAESFAESMPGPDGVRHELVRRVRREIASGVYDTPEKLELALERLLNHLQWA